MANLLIQLWISFISIWSTMAVLNGTVINCTVYPVIIQWVPKEIIGTITIANENNEEIHWSQVRFERNVQFPLTFQVGPNELDIQPGMHMLDLHIYEFPRADYDAPLWTANTNLYLENTNTTYPVDFLAHSDREPGKPCIMGIIINIENQLSYVRDHELSVQLGTMRPLVFHIPMNSLPILFLIADIPLSQIDDSTYFAVSVKDTSAQIAYESTQSTRLTLNDECTPVLFKVTQARSMHLNVILSAHVFTSVSLFSLAATYKIYHNSYLIFSKTQIILKLEFPILISEELVPITTPSNYSIVATIFGPLPGKIIGETLFEGMKYADLVPGTNNTVRVSMTYTGSKIGTTIIGTIHPNPPDANTWPLSGAILDFTISHENTGLIGSNRFTIYDQRFPLQFTIFDTQAINESYQSIIFSVSISRSNNTVLWASTTENNRITYGVLNRIETRVVNAAGFPCLQAEDEECNAMSLDIQGVCCSQFRCAGNCQLPW